MEMQVLMKFIHFHKPRKHSMWVRLGLGIRLAVLVVVVVVELG